jgi:hypothetical protein
MTVSARRGAPASSVTITPADERVLLALNRFHHLSAEQVRRLLYGRGSLKYAYERLKRLVDAGFVSHDQARGMVGVFALSGRGRSYLAELGFDVLPRWRPSEEKELGASYYRHALAVADVLIAAELLGHEHPRIELTTMLHDRELKHRYAVPVQLANSKPRSVIPDGWLDFRVEMADGRFRMPVVLELDRGMHERRRWQQKVEALIAFAGGPYQEAYGTASLIVAVVATPGESRRAELTAWTEGLLRTLRVEHEADLFRLTGADPVVDPVAFFCGPVWYRPFDLRPLPLLEPREGGA